MLVKSKRELSKSAIFLLTLAAPYIVPSTSDVQTQPNISVQPAPPSEQSPTVHPEQEPSPGGLKAPDFFRKAADKGVFFQLSFSEELAANPSGGIRQGITGSQYLTFGADLDLQQIIGWSGAAFHTVVLAENNTGLSKDYIGGGIDVQENFAPFNLVRFLNFTIEQEVSLSRHNDLHLIVGRMAVTPYFTSSVLTCLFMNHVYCGMMYGFTQSTGSAVAPVSSWGGLAKFYATPKAYVQSGGFAVDANTFKAATNIFDWGTKGVSGINYLAEGGHETSFESERLPHYYRIGRSYLDAPRNDVLLNTDGLPYFKFGGAQLVHRGETALYFTGGQAIARPDPSSHRNAGVFASMYYNFADSEAIKYSVRAGVVKAGTFKGRDHDTLGFAFSPTVFTSKEVAFLTGMRNQNGGVGQVASHEWIIELNYGYELKSGVSLRPNLQYIVNPDPRYTPTYPSRIPNAFVIGLQVNANIGTLFSLPRIGQ